MSQVTKRPLSQWRLNIQRDAAELDIKEKLGYALRLCSRGKSEREAAKIAHVGREQIRRFVNTKEFWSFFFALSACTQFCFNLFPLL